jgi:hypothetical protein
MTRTHSTQQVHPSYAKRDRLPDITPIVGDRVRYLSGTGIEIWPLNALSMLRRGEKVFYEAYEDELG